MTRLVALGIVALLSLPGVAHAVSADELVGAWHVLVHYKDSNTGNPDAERWEDRIWVFEKEGTKLRWTDYPIVVFSDDTGRFDRSERGRYSRVLDYWEPNSGQKAQIRSGLAINNRGSRTKALRGSDAKGWSSAGRRGYQSARVITYEEVWTIDGLPDAPVFERQDSMGAAGSEKFEGRTVYETTSVEEGGDVLRGNFDRDGHRTGTFRLMRSGEVHSVGQESKTASGEEVRRTDFIAMLAPGLEQLPGDRSEDEWRAAATGPEAKQERLALRAAFEEGLRTQVLTDEDIRTHFVLLSNLAVELERRFVEDGKSLSELRKMMRGGELSAAGGRF
ncbi:MAG: hypothetical protein ABFS41_08025 [Myxococcota bacterium]